MSVWIVEFGADFVFADSWSSQGRDKHMVIFETWAGAKVYYERYKYGEALEELCKRYSSEYARGPFYMGEPKEIQFGDVIKS